MLQKPSKTRTTSLKRLKYSLHWSQEYPLDDPWCPQKFFYQNFCEGTSKFLLSGKYGAPKGVRRYKNLPTHFRMITKMWRAVHQNFGQKFVWGHHETSREYFWDHFKLYLMLSGLLVWVLEGLFLSRIHFLAHHFCPITKIWKPLHQNFG